MLRWCCPQSMPGNLPGSWRRFRRSSREWLRAAVLRAKQMIGARLGRFKPHRRVAAGNHFALHAEGGNREAMEDVLRDHGQLHGPVDRECATRRSRAGRPDARPSTSTACRRCRCSWRWWAGCRCGNRAARPRQKQTRKRASGIIVQVASSSVEPSIWVATGFFSLRYRTEKVTTMSMTTAIMPISRDQQQKEDRTRRHGAKSLEASGGKRGELRQPLYEKLPQYWTYIMHRYPLSDHVFPS